jgi:hypothetical protein
MFRGAFCVGSNAWPQYGKWLSSHRNARMVKVVLSKKLIISRSRQICTLFFQSGQAHRLRFHQVSIYYLGREVTTEIAKTYLISTQLSLRYIWLLGFWKSRYQRKFRLEGPDLCFPVGMYFVNMDRPGYVGLDV